MQKVLTLITSRESMRAPVEGWTSEDGDWVYLAWEERLGTENEYQIKNDVPVGLIRSGMMTTPKYPTVLHALGDGWKLLAPPNAFDENGTSMYEWWLVRD